MPQAAAAPKEITPRRGPGAPPGEAHGRAVLTDDRVRLLRELHRQGFTKAKLARAFRVSATTVAQVVLRRTWRHVLDEAR